LPREKRIEELRKWCHYLLREANRDGLIVTAIHPKLTLEELKEASPREVITVEANTVSNLLVTLGIKRTPGEEDNGEANLRFHNGV